LIDQAGVEPAPVHQALVERAGVERARESTAAIGRRRAVAPSRLRDPIGPYGGGVSAQEIPARAVRA
jgi:hypothetical protein